MSHTHNCPCTEACPLQKAALLIGGKWKLSIICSLAAEGTARYNDLKRRLAPISNTMLAKSLKELEDAALVSRNEYLEVPIRVEYALTEKTQALLPILQELAVWASSLEEPEKEGN